MKNYNCWYCGYLLDPLYERDTPKDYRYFFSCINHGKYFVTFIIDDQDDLVEFMDIFEKENFVDRVKDAPILTFDLLENALYLDEVTILPNSMLKFLDYQPEDMVEKIKKLSTWL